MICSNWYCTWILPDGNCSKAVCPKHGKFDMSECPNLVVISESDMEELIKEFG